MKFRNARGYTLIELMLSAGILLTGLISISVVIQMQMEAFNQVTDEQRTEGDNKIVFAPLRSAISQSGRSFMAFSGAAGEPPATFRLLIPNACADLHKRCGGSTALLLAGPRPKAPITAVLCATRAGGSKVRLILNMSNAGVLSFGAPEVGPISSLMPGDLVATGLLQRSLLLAVDSAASSYDPIFIPDENRYADALFNDNPDCVRGARTGQKLMQLTVRPVLIPNSGRTSPAIRDVERELGPMPSQMVIARVIAMGKVAAVPKIASTECRLVGGRFICDKESSLVEQTERVDFQFLMKKPLLGATKVFPLGVQPDLCTTEQDCVLLSYSEPVPRKLAGETYEWASGAQYSLVKTDLVASILVNVWQKNKRKSVHVSVL